MFDFHRNTGRAGTRYVTTTFRLYMPARLHSRPVPCNMYHRYVRYRRSRGGFLWFSFNEQGPKTICVTALRDRKARPCTTFCRSFVVSFDLFRKRYGFSKFDAFVLNENRLFPFNPIHVLSLLNLSKKLIKYGIKNDR